MKQSIGYVSVIVQDYDEAIKFYVETLGFRLVEDTFTEDQNKCWVLVAPPGYGGTKLLLAQADGVEQSSRVGNQTGGRVFLFLHTDDFWCDFNNYKSKKALSSSGSLPSRATARLRYSKTCTAIYGTCWN